MLTSRRDLLKIFTAATAVASAAPAALAVTNGDKYWNRRIQLELEKPPGWHFWSIIDFQVAAAQQVLHEDTPTEAEEILRSPESAPFLVIAKKHASAEGVSSAICAYDENRDGSFPSAVPCLQEALSAYSRFLGGVRIRQGSASTVVPGTLDASAALWEFDFERTSGATNPVAVLTVLSYRPGRMQTMHFMALGAEATHDACVLQASRASVRYSDA
jgi:hypothetical protein